MHHNLRYGFLFLPAAVAAVVAVLAPSLVALDRSGGSGGVGGFRAEPDAARAVLATIAGSLITVAGLTFSITVVSLQLVSQQFSPRALRGFLGDRMNQVVAGAFIGTFVYRVLVLRTVSEGADRDERFVPGLSVTGAVVLAVASIALLLVFIHHMARTIQVSTIATSIANATSARSSRSTPRRSASRRTTIPRRSSSTGRQRHRRTSSTRRARDTCSQPSSRGSTASSRKGA